MYILGISGTEYEFYHDPSAALLKDGKVIAACEEERFNRIKHSPGKPPEKAIHYCLESAHLTLKDIDCIAYNVNLEDRITEEKSKEQIDKILSIIQLRFRHHYRIPPIFRVSHHITHIASAFYQSGFKDAACLIVDGQGEYESVTLATARGNIIQEIKKYGIIDSIGFLYDAASYYCGFSFNSAGKLMGLAPYGRPCQKIPLSFDVKKEKFIHSLFRTPKEIPNKLPLAFDLMQAYLEHFKRYNYPYKR